MRASSFVDLRSERREAKGAVRNIGVRERESERDRERERERENKESKKRGCNYFFF